LNCVLDVDACQFGGELGIAFGIVDVFAQLRGFGGGNPSADVATIAPNLVLVVGAYALGFTRIRIWTLAPLFGKGSCLHGGDGGDLI
jgi:hypothetical protein